MARTKVNGASAAVLLIRDLVLIALGSIVCQVMLVDEVNTILDKFANSRRKRPEQNHGQAD